MNVNFLSLGLLRPEPSERGKVPPQVLPDLLEAAKRERVLPQVLRHLQGPPVAAMLEASRRSRGRLESATSEVVRALRGLAFLIIKGFAVEHYYPDDAWRQFGDVDILLPDPADLPEAIDRLLASGFCFKTIWHKGQDGARSLVSPMWHPDLGINADLHAGRYPGYGTRYGADPLGVDLWTTSVDCPRLWGARLTCAKGSLLVLVAHLHLNGLSRKVRDANDLYALCRGRELDWDEIWHQLDGHAFKPALLTG